MIASRSLFKPSYAYGREFNSYDLLKLIALLAMVIDHLGEFIWPHTEWLRAIGRAAFPLFLFLVGYSGKWKVSRELIVQASIILLCALLTNHPLFALNILFTIALTRVVMRYLTRYEMTPSFLLHFFVAMVALWIAFLWCDYSTIALLFAVCGYLMRHKPNAPETAKFLYATVLLHFLIEWIMFDFHMVSVLIMLAVATGVTFCIKNFRIVPIEWKAKSANRLLLWSARNTLPLYTFHVLLFMVLEKLLFPARLLHFQWL